MVVAERTKLTYEDYAKTPEGARYQLLDGEIIEFPTPPIAHQIALGNLLASLSDFVDKKGWGEVFLIPTDVVLNDTNTVQPDLFVISSERSSIITRDNIQGAPDLIIEILSPFTKSLDWGIKLELYAEHGVKEYWLASTDEERVWVLLLGENGLYAVVGVYGTGDTLTSPTLEGFALELTDVFE